MSNSKIFQLFNTTNLEFPVAETTLNELINLFIQRHSCTIEFIEIVLVDNLEIRRINSEYLQRDYITDVISFHYHEVSEFRDALSRPSLEGTCIVVYQGLSNNPES